MLELRVLTGTHAGARALLPDGPQVLGSGDDCDLILTDEGVLAQHARMELQADGSTVLRWLGGDLPAIHIRPGEGAALGPVHIAVEDAHAPWRTDVPIREMPLEVQDDGARGLDDAQGPDGVLEGTLPELAAQAAEARQAVVHPAVAPNFVLVALSVLALASIVAVWWAVHSASAPAPARQANNVAKASAAATEALNKAIAALGFGPRVRVEAGKSPVPVVHGYLLTEAETETLAAALTRLSPRPSLKLVSTEDVTAMVKERLAQVAAEGAKGVSLGYAGEGRFLLQGLVADDPTREQLLSDLRSHFSMVSAFDSRLVTRAEAAVAMLEDLRQQGLADVTGTWTDGVLQLDVKLAPVDIPRWERALLAAAARHDLRFRATLDLTATPVAPLRLPFSVRSVVSGELPFVMLADGRKLVAGATVNGWQLVAVQPEAVVFEAPDRRRVILER